MRTLEESIKLTSAFYRRMAEENKRLALEQSGSAVPDPFYAGLATGYEICANDLLTELDKHSCNLTTPA